MQADIRQIASGSNHGNDTNSAVLATDRIPIVNCQGFHLGAFPPHHGNIALVGIVLRQPLSVWVLARCQVFDLHVESKTVREVQHEFDRYIFVGGD